MRKTINICDRCGREVKWLYSMPVIKIEGYNMEVYYCGEGCDDLPELCENCARKAISVFNEARTNK